MRKRNKSPFDYEHGDTDLIQAETLINGLFALFYDRDDYSKPNFDDLTEVNLLFRETQGKAHWIKVDVDLVNFTMKRYYDWKLTQVTAYKSLYVMNKKLLEKMNIYTLMNISKGELEIANAQNQYDCVNDIIKIITYDEDANPEIFTPYTVDCVKKALATIINRLPEGENIKFSPQNREWAKDITDEVWQAEKIDFDPEVLDQFTEFVKDYEEEDQLDKSRDVVKYRREFLEDPHKREIYLFADSLDRLQIFHDRDSYCDNKVDSDDNMEKIYNQVVSNDTREITTYLNDVYSQSLNIDERRWVEVLLKQLKNIENGYFRNTQEKFVREGNSYVFPDFSEKDKAGERVRGTGIVDLALRIVSETYEGFCNDNDRFEAELALYSALIGYLYYTRSKRSTFKDLYDLANTFVKDEGAVRERIHGREKTTRQAGGYPFCDYGNLSIDFLNYEYDQFLNYAEVPYGQYVDDLLEWLDHNNLCS